jgi:hypothetical protein
MKQLPLDIYNPPLLKTLKGELGWWDHGQGEQFSSLVAVCMVLCDKVEELQITIAKLQKEDQS